VTLDHFVMVRIHARQLIKIEALTIVLDDGSKGVLTYFAGISSLRSSSFAGFLPAIVCDFGSQGCRFEPCRVQIKFQS
jgi:hypothetical protein